MPNITVVVPAYNSSKYLGLTISSVLNQTHVDWELIIVDDGSTDTTAEIARSLCDEDHRIRLIQQRNAGVAAARNAGLSAAGADSRYVVFLDSDDLWEPDCLELLFDAAEASPSCVGAVGRIKQIDCNGKSITTPMRAASMEAVREELIDGRLVELGPEKPTTFASLAVSGSIWTTGSILVRKDPLNKLHGFDTSFWTAEDNDLWIRLSRLGDIKFVNKHVLHYRHHDNMLSGDRGKILRSIRRTVQKAALSPDNTRKQAAILCKSYRAAELRYTLGLFPQVKRNLRNGKIKESVKESKLFLGGLIRYIAGPKHLKPFKWL